jgi:flavin-dependent dehydrogenase
MYDAIVVGARCAGAPTAMLLARKGYRVLLVDRGSFPSDTISTHYIHQPGVARLARWGLLERVVASNCPPISGQTLDVGPFALEGAPTPVDGIADAYAPRRTVLDAILVAAAVAAGAELRERFSVEELLTDGERITGIRGHAAGGATVTEQARIVIGADGLRSFMARGVDAPGYNHTPALTCAYYTYWSDVPIGGAELYPCPGRSIVAATTNFWPQAEFHRVRADIEGSFLAALDLAPGLAERARAGKRAERFRGTADLPNHFRQSFGPGWALVGDAGYYKDPITAQGISDAFRDADLLAEAIDAGMSGRQTLAEALASYQSRRDEAAAPGFATTLQFAQMEPPTPEMQQLFGALRHNRAQVGQLFGTIAGSVHPAAFFAPENMGQIMMAAAA